MTAATADERSLLPGPIWPSSVPAPSFPLTDRRPVVLADDPCEAGFSGADPEYAGIYLHVRYFDPQLGTFLSPDPIGVEGGMNQYAYAGGDPVNITDRSGLTGTLICIGNMCYPSDGGSGGAGGIHYPGGGGGAGSPWPYGSPPPDNTDRTVKGILCFMFGAFCGPPQGSTLMGPNMALPQQGPPQERGAYIPDHPTGPPPGVPTSGTGSGGGGGGGEGGGGTGGGGGGRGPRNTVPAVFQVMHWIQYPPDVPRLPDYYSANCGIGKASFGASWGGGGSAYLGGGRGWFGSGCSVNANWGATLYAPSRGRIAGYMGGFSGGASAYAGLGGGVVVTAAGPVIQAGLGFPPHASVALTISQSPMDALRGFFSNFASSFYAHIGYPPGEPVYWE